MNSKAVIYIYIYLSIINVLLNFTYIKMDNLKHLSWAFKSGLYNYICMPSFTTKSAFVAALSMMEKQLELQLNLHFLLFSRCYIILELLSDTKRCLILVIRCLQVSPICGITSTAYKFIYNKGL